MCGAKALCQSVGWGLETVFCNGEGGALEIGALSTGTVPFNLQNKNTIKYLILGKGLVGMSCLTCSQVSSVDFFSRKVTSESLM